MSASALSMFKKYYLDDNADNPYFHALCHENRSIFLLKYENDSPERNVLMNQLNAGEYPSLDWMLENPLIDATIAPGSNKWKPTGIHDTPPYGRPKAKPTDIKDALTGVLSGFLEALDDSVRPVASAVNFFRIDMDERYEIPVPPLYIRRAVEGDGGGFGVDLLSQARYLAENKTGVPLFTANLQQYKDELRDGSMKIYYKYNGSKYESRVFKKIRIGDILAGNEMTVQIEMIVEDEGAQIKDGDLYFD